MRKTLASTMFLGAFVLTACGDDSSGGNKDAALSIDGSSAIDARPVDARPVDAARPDSGPIDAAGMITPPTTDAGQGSVACGTGMTCDQASQECCVTVVGMAVNAMCVTKGSCAGAGTINCDGPEDCNGAQNQVCCGHFSGATMAGAASCKTYGPNAGECSGDLNLNFGNPAASSGDVVLCHTAKQISTECPSDKRTCQSCMFGGQAFTFCTATVLPTIGGFCTAPPP